MNSINHGDSSPRSSSIGIVGTTMLLLASLSVAACLDDAEMPMEMAEDGADAGMTTTALCIPPPLLKLDEIPDDPSLNTGDDDKAAVFEVMGHKLIGKHVTDVAAAEGGLKLWQEFTLRIPENQLQDLVQLDIYLDTDPVAYFNRNGDVMTERVGLKIGFSTKNFAQNDPDPCAPLQPRRGTFDWSMIHEFGHLRGWLDGTWPEFLNTFPNVEGPGDGYPEDGSPVLDRDFVTSYAERDDGDEDYAETFTTYVMLGDSAISAEAVAGEPLATAKVRWMGNLPGMSELRLALRVSEDDAEAADVVPLARLLDVHPQTPGPPPAVFQIPSWLHGTWRQTPTDGWVIVATSDDIVSSLFTDGVESERVSIKGLNAAGEIHRWNSVDGATSDEQPAYGYRAKLTTGLTITDTFQIDEPGRILFVGVDRGEGFLDKVD